MMEIFLLHINGPVYDIGLHKGDSREGNVECIGSGVEFRRGSNPVLRC